MVELIKEKYMKNTGDKEKLPNVADMINRLYQAENASIDAGIEAAEQEYKEKMNKLNQAKKEQIEIYKNFADQLLELSQFRLEDIAPVLAEIISLFEGKEYEYKTSRELLYGRPKYYIAGIKAKEEGLNFMAHSEMFLNKGEYKEEMKDSLEFFGYVMKTSENFMGIKKHTIFNRCPYLLEFIEILINKQVAKLPINEQLAAIKKAEAEFIHKNVNTIKKRHKEINEQEKQEYQTKLEQDVLTRENILSKALEKINTKSELSK